MSSSSTAAIASENPLLARKLGRLQSLNAAFDSPEFLAALDGIAEVFDSNTEKARRGLKFNIERRESDVQSRFLASYSHIHKQVQQIEEITKEMERSYAEMSLKLDAIHSQTSSLLIQTSQLQSSNDSIEVKRKVVDTILVHFTLSPDDIALLSGASAATTPLSPLSPSATVLTDDFFGALRRLQNIINNCKKYLIGENARLGLEIMQSLRAYEDASYERIFQYAQSSCRALGKDGQHGSVVVSETLKNSFQALSEKPALFQNCIDEFSQVRRGLVVRSFLDALTRGGPNGQPRPIEMQAHDPLRYVGDMLAWIHQTLIGERELFESLFEECLRGGSGASGRRESAAAPRSNSGKVRTILTAENIRGILNKIIESSCRPLKVRVEQVLVSQPGVTVTYKLANLVQFYQTTIERILGRTGPLFAILDEIVESSFKLFTDSINHQADRWLKNVQPAKKDLLPPLIVKEALGQLKDIIISHEASLTSKEKREDEFSSILTVFLDPILRVCSIAAEKLSVEENGVFMINCLYMIQTTLALFPFTSARVKLIETQIEGYVSILINNLYDSIVRDSGLAHIIYTVQSRPQDAPLSQIQGMEGPAVQAAMARFEKFLLTVNQSAGVATEKLTSSRFANAIHRKAYQRFFDAYKSMSDAIMDPKEKYVFPSTLLTRTVEEVETLLSID